MIAFVLVVGAVVVAWVVGARADRPRSLGVGVGAPPSAPPVADGRPTDSRPTHARLSATPFDPERDDGVPPPTSSCPPHLRRVRVEIAFADGAPLARTEARPVRVDAKDASATWNGDVEGVTASTTTDREGRAAVDVPPGVAFRMAGKGGPAYPPFLSEPAIVVDDVARCVVAAGRPTLLQVRRADGAPAAGVAFDLVGSGTGGQGTAAALTDADGVATFRGFVDAFATAVLGRPYEVAGGRRRHVIVSRWEGPAERLETLDENSVAHVAVGATTTAHLRTLPWIDGRVVDANGAPVPHARCTLKVEIGAAPGADVVVDTATSAADGRFSLALPKNDDALRSDLVVSSYAVEVVGPDGRAATPLRRVGDPGDGADVGDVVVGDVRWFRVVAEDDLGPVENFEFLRAGTDAPAGVGVPEGDGSFEHLFAARPGDAFEARTPRHAPASFVAGDGGTFDAPVRRVVRFARAATLLVRAAAGDGPVHVIASADLRFAAGARRDAASSTSSWRLGAEATCEKPARFEALQPGVRLRLEATPFDFDVDLDDARVQSLEGPLFPVACLSTSVVVEVPPLLAGETRVTDLPRAARSAEVRIFVDAEEAMGDRDAADVRLTLRRDGREESIAALLGVPTVIQAPPGPLDVTARRDAVAVTVAADVVAPSTELVVRLPASRTVELRLRGGSDAVDVTPKATASCGEMLFDAVVAARSDAKPTSADSTGETWTVVARAPVDREVVFDVSIAGARVRRSAPPGVDVVEATLPRFGALRVSLPPTPVAGFDEVVVRALDVEWSETRRVRRAPDGGRHVLDPVPVAAGRYAVEVRRAFSLRGEPPKNDAPRIAWTRDVAVAGDAVVDLEL